MCVLAILDEREIEQVEISYRNSGHAVVADLLQADSIRSETSS